MRGVELVVEQEPRLILTLERFVQQIIGLFGKHGIEASFTDGNEKGWNPLDLTIDLSRQLKEEREKKGDYVEYAAWRAEEEEIEVQRRINAITTLKGFGDLKLISQLDFGVFHITKPTSRYTLIYGGHNWDGIIVSGTHNGRSITAKFMRDFVAAQDEVMGFLEKLSTGQPHPTTYNEGRRYFIPINIPPSLQETIYDRRAPCLVA